MFLGISAIPLFPPERASRSEGSSPQRGIVVGDDPFEHEADRVADQVMRMPDPELSIATAPAQLSRKCVACDEEEAKMLQPKPVGPAKGAASEAPGIVHEVLRSPGRPLEASARAFFEPRFRFDFSRVRIHTEPIAAESARAVNALAYTVGPDIVFREGQFTTETNTGKRLLAHELAHVAQQPISVGGIGFHSPAPPQLLIQRQDNTDAVDQPDQTDAGNKADATDKPMFGADCGADFSGLDELDSIAPSGNETEGVVQRQDAGPPAAPVRLGTSCLIPTSFSRFFQGTPPSNPKAAAFTKLNYTVQSGRIAMDQDRAASWVDRNQVTVDGTRSGATASKVAACQRNFDSGHTTFTFRPN